MKKKFGVTVIIILLIIAIYIFFSSIANKSKYEFVEENINKNFFLMGNEKYGVINKQGEVVIQNKYDIIQIPNPEKPVFICMKNYKAETGEYDTNVYNEKGEEIFTNFYKVEAIYINEPTDGNFYQKNVLKYKENGKYGLINLEGKKITKALYEDIESLEYKQGMLLVKRNGKFGIINLKGQKIIDFKYDKIESDCFFSEETGSNKTRTYCFK